MATNFLHATGTNGLLVSAFAIVDSTDLDSLTNGSAVTSATGVHSNGQFSQTDTGSAQYGYVMLTVGNPGWTPTAGGCLTGWFMLSQDGAAILKHRMPLQVRRWLPLLVRRILSSRWKGQP